jgi:flagellar motor protein MotB
MNHCHQIFKCATLALLIAAVGLTGCQQTSPTARNHNSLFDFSQRPRFFGENAVQNPLPQVARNNGSGQIPNPLAGLGGTDYSNRTPVNRPFGYIFGRGNDQASATPTPANGIPTNSPQQYQQFSQMANQVNALNQRASAFDSDNQLLNTEVAGLKQKLELANQYNQTLKEQLADTSGRIQQSEIERNKALAQAEEIKQLAQQQARQFQQQQQPNINQGQFAQVASQPWQRQGDSQRQNDRFASSDSFNGQGRDQFASATIRANNSLMRRLNDIDIPGGEARMDGDVIRIEFPSDRMFVSGSYQIAPSQRPVLSDIVSTVRRSFPRQIIGVEAHWDNTPLNPPGTTDHQLTATQSLAVFEELIRLGLPERQMFTMAMASNRPRHPAGSFGGVSPNRRIELVIYPESYDGS